MTPISDLKGLIKDSRERGLGVRAAPPIYCPDCGKQVVIFSYVLMRPESGECPNGHIWEDDRERVNVCTFCGFSEEEHAEGKGCQQPNVE